MFFFIVNNSFGAKVNLPNGKSFHVNSKEFSGVEYARFCDLSSKIFPKAKCNTIKSIIESEDWTIHCLNGAFFVVLQRQKTVAVMQMSMPSISYNDDLYVPINDFVRAMTFFKFYKPKAKPQQTKETEEVTDTRKMPRIEKNNKPESSTTQATNTDVSINTDVTKTTEETSKPEESTQNELSDDFYKSFRQISNIIQDSILLLEPSLRSENTKGKNQDNVNPRSYRLPKDLKRKELEEEKNN